MKELIDYIVTHVERGSCECGRCIDAPEKSVQPEGHTADLVFFKVRAIGDPKADELRPLLKGIDLFDGKEHSYLEIGAWIGDQGLAMMLMGLGKLLGMWDLLTPRMFGPSLPDELALQMAGQGYLTIRAKK